MEKECLFCHKVFRKKWNYSSSYFQRAKFCSSKCAGTYNCTAERLIGRERPAEVYLKMQRTMFKKGHTSPNKGREIYSSQGLLHWNWKGGKTGERQKMMQSLRYKQWRSSVFERDNFTCQWCGQRGGRLHADHIAPWSKFPDLRFDLSNGRCLCVECHQKTDTWGGRVHKEPVLAV